MQLPPSLAGPLSHSSTHAADGQDRHSKEFILELAVVAQTLSVNGGPVVFSWNKEQSDAARNCKDRTVIKHSSVTDAVPQ